MKQHLTKNNTIGLILVVLLNFIKTAKNIKIHCHIESYMNLSVITGEENRPDMTVTQNESMIFVNC